MADNIKVAVSEQFMDAFVALPRNIQQKVLTFMNKFRNNPAAPGINYETLRSGKDKKLCSVRIDDAYRAIAARQPETGVYMLLWVDHHDKAYEWAENRKCGINPQTGAIQIYEAAVTSPPELNSDKPKLFSAINDADLFALGLPEDLLGLARSISGKEDFYAQKNRFPAGAFEALQWLAEDIPLQEVKELILSERSDERDDGNLAKALENPESLKSFAVIDSEAELRAIMDAPLEKWRVFLHPCQREIVRKKYAGPARVLGSAGTGKTVVAMHRAKYLAASLKDGERLLFTTFNANLAADIAENLRKICADTEELSRIEVINLDKWVTQFLGQQKYPAKIPYDDKSKQALERVWDDAIDSHDPDREFPKSFYQDEYNRVVAAREAFSLEQYLKASRIGRGTKLSRKQRFKVWEVFAEYLNLMKKRGICDINYAQYECCRILAQGTAKPRYKHIIVDEAQDMSAGAFRLLRALAGEEHENDIFIVGDAHQRIYKNKAALSQCGINIRGRGRSSTLRINYRTTEEIRKAAIAVLNGLSFDDLDEGSDIDERCQSLTHGTAPQIRCHDNSNQEFAAVLAEIKGLLAGGTAAENICVTARTHKLLDDYIRGLTENGLRCYEIKGSSADNRRHQGIRAATMHRVKGLEFQYVFIAAANKGVLPLEQAIDRTDAVSEAESVKAEQCLLYVALTRAQKGAYVSGYGKLSAFLAGSAS